MKIALLRHGKPEVANWGSISSKNFSCWIKEYNQAGICRESSPDQETIRIANSCKSVICSSLQRSVDSAKIIRPESIIIKNKLFCELELPHGEGDFFKFKPSIWAVIFRVLWFFGYSLNAESIAQGKLRIKNATKILIEESQCNHSVLLVAHSFVNRMVAQELIQNGWACISKPKSGYWGISVYEKSK